MTVVVATWIWDQREETREEEDEEEEAMDSKVVCRPR